MKYFKQYGEQRTGTNYLKSLLELNFEEATVFASVLGWKHGMYEVSNYKERWYMNNLKTFPEFEAESHKDWVRKMSKGIDPKTAKPLLEGQVLCVDNYVLPFSADELNYACDNLNYIFMVKDIYGFVYSFKMFRHRRLDWEDVLKNGWVKRWCNRYELNYKRWVELFEDNKDNSIFVQYEDLIQDKNKILSQFESKFKLTKKHKGYVDEDKVVQASTDMGLIKTKIPFDKNFYLNRRYMDHLPGKVKEIIDNKYNSPNFQILLNKISNRVNLS